MYSNELILRIHVVTTYVLKNAEIPSKSDGMRDLHIAGKKYWKISRVVEVITSANIEFITFQKRFASYLGITFQN